MPQFPLSATTHELPGGLRVRLRLARPRDLRRIQALLRACGHPEQPADRLVHLDPRQRVVICATALTDEGVRLLGVTAKDVGARRAEFVCVDEDADEAVGHLLRRAVEARVAAISHRRAA